MKPGDVVFLSASVPYRLPWTREAQSAEIEQAIVSIARAVFARGGRLLFGGHPSVSPLIADIAGEYYPIDPRRKVRPIVTVQSRFFEKQLPKETWDLFTMGWSAIEWTPAGEGRDDSVETMRSSMLFTDEAGWKIARSNELQPPITMFAVGGMEGIRDEAAMFLKARRQWPHHQRAKVYVFGTPGGAAARLLEPAGQWRDRLWPAEEFVADTLETLLGGLRNGDLVNLERQWAAHLKTEVPRFELQPYGAMTQWALDEALRG